jgi:RNA polymerase sigma-70 factor (ECF subfamily)
MPVEPEKIARVLIRERVKIQAFIRGIVSDYHTAEDVFQEVSMLVFRESEKINDESHLLAWVRRAARHRAINAAKASGRRTLSLDESLLSAIDQAWESYDHEPTTERAQALERCMDRLSPSAKRLVYLRYTEGLTGDRLASQVSRSASSVYVSLSRIHQALAKCIRASLTQTM